MSSCVYNIVTVVAFFLHLVLNYHFVVTSSCVSLLEPQTGLTDISKNELVIMTALLSQTLVLRNFNMLHSLFIRNFY